MREDELFHFNGPSIPLRKESKMRKFDTGATRDDDEEKLDYEGFLSPFVLKQYAEYMHKHRKQADNEMRASDNWQKGIPFNAYMKSMFRHMMDLWTAHREMPDNTWNVERRKEALCAILFNTSGMLHELTKPALRINSGTDTTNPEVQPEDWGPLHPKTQLHIRE